MVKINLKNSDFRLGFDEFTSVQRIIMHNSFQIVFADFADIVYVRIEESMNSVTLFGRTDTYQVQVKNSEQIFEFLQRLKVENFIQVNSQNFANINECLFIGLRNNAEVLFLRDLGYIPFPNKNLIQQSLGMMIPQPVKNTKQIRTKMIPIHRNESHANRLEVRLQRTATY